MYSMRRIIYVFILNNVKVFIHYTPIVEKTITNYELRNENNMGTLITLYHLAHEAISVKCS